MMGFFYLYKSLLLKYIQIFIHFLEMLLENTLQPF